MADYQLTQTGAETQDALDTVGTAPLTTTAQDLSGAVNELDTDLDSKSGVRYFTSVVVSVASGGEMFRITDASITTDTIVLDCVFADQIYIRSNVTWTSYAGYVAFYGTCVTSTTADVILTNKVN